MQAIFSQHRTAWTKRKSNAQNYLGHGLLYCECGRQMHPKTDGRPGKPNYYVCATQCNGETPCGQKMLPTGIVDQQIEAWVILHLRNKKKIREMLLKDTHTDNQQLAAQEKSRIVKAIADLEKKKSRLVLSLEDLDTSSTVTAKGRIKELAIQIYAQKAKLLSHERSHKTVSAVDIDKRVDEIYARALQYPKFDLEKKKALLRQTFLRLSLDDEGTIVGYVLNLTTQFCATC